MVRLAWKVGHEHLGRSIRLARGMHCLASNCYGGWKIADLYAAISQEFWSCNVRAGLAQLRVQVMWPHAQAVYI